MAELSTFGQTAAHIEQPQNNDQQNTVQQSQDTQQQTDQTQNTDTSQTDQQAQVSQSADTQAQQQQDNSVSTVDLSFLEKSTDAQQAATQQQSTTTAVKYNLDEELKKVDPSEVLKKLGMSDFAIELDKHIKGGGQPIDYLNAKAIDYNKISDENIIKDSLRKQYPSFTSQDIDLFYQRKYGISEDAPDDDKRYAELNLKADAQSIRQSAINEQQKFKIADPVQIQKDEEYDQWKSNREIQNQIIEKIDNFYSSHDATKKLNESKRVTIDLGKDVAPFHFQIDKPEFITRSFTDGGEIWQKLTSTPQGEPDVAKQQLIALFSFNPQKFIQDIFKYGQSHGLKEVVEEGQNAQRPQAKVTQMSTGGQSVSTGKFADRARN